MKWFRRRIKTGSRLALLALALQFVLSFGHSHFGVAHAAPVIQALTDLAQTQSPGAEGNARQAEQQPASHDDGQPSNEPCAICAVMAMANQVLFVTPALLSLPDAVEVAFLVDDAEFSHLASLWRSFQSRAPPLS